MGKNKIPYLEKSSKTVVIAADLHLKKKPGLWSGRAEIAGDDEYALRQVVDIANANNADLYLLGDTFDSITNIPRPIIMAFNYLSNIQNQIRYIQGNHDMVVQADFSTEPWLHIIQDEMKTARHINGCAFDFCTNLTGYALDYFPSMEAAEYFSTIPANTDILMLHGTADIIMPLRYHFEYKLIPDHVKFIIAGDYHQNIEYINDNGPILLYPGATYVGATSELGDKYCIIMHQDEAGLLHYEFKKLHTRQFITYSSVTSFNVDDLKRQVDDYNESELQDASASIKTPVFIIDTVPEQENIDILKAIGHIYMTPAAYPETTVIDSSREVDSMPDEEILEQYMNRPEHQEEFDFTMDVIENNVEDAITRLKNRLEIDEKDIASLSTVINM